MALQSTLDPRNAAFAKRLAKASDQARVPALHKGRLVWMETRLGVSREAARKWFAGETMPRRGMLKNLANALKVDEAWLSLGSEEARPRDIKVDAVTSATIEQSSHARVSYHTATDQLKVLVDDAVSGKSTVIERDYQVQAVLIGIDEWQRLSNIPSFGRLLMDAPFDGDDFASRSTAGLRPVDL